MGYKFNPFTGTLDVVGAASTGTANSVSATVDFGFASANEGDVATTTVAASWVTSSTILVCSFAGVTTADHDPEDPVVESLTAYASNIVAGVGFDVIARAPQNTWGRYQVNIIGV